MAWIQRTHVVSWDIFLNSLVLILGKNDSVEVAADKVAKHDASVNSEYLPNVRLKE